MLLCPIITTIARREQAWSLRPSYAAIAIVTAAITIATIVILIILLTFVCCKSCCRT